MSKLETFWIKYTREGDSRDGELFCVRESDYMPRHYIVAWGNGKVAGEHLRREFCQPAQAPVE